MIKLKSVLWYASTIDDQISAYCHLKEMLKAGYKYAILNEYNKLIMFTKKEVNCANDATKSFERKIVEINNISIKLIPNDFNENACNPQ